MMTGIAAKKEKIQIFQIQIFQHFAQLEEGPGSLSG
jgi:hypothetical protein